MKKNIKKYLFICCILLFIIGCGTSPLDIVITKYPNYISLITLKSESRHYLLVDEFNKLHYINISLSFKGYYIEIDQLLSLTLKEE